MAVSTSLPRLEKQTSNLHPFKCCMGTPNYLARKGVEKLLSSLFKIRMKLKAWVLNTSLNTNSKTAVKFMPYQYNIALVQTFPAKVVVLNHCM